MKRTSRRRPPFLCAVILVFLSFTYSAAMPGEPYHGSRLIDETIYFQAESVTAVFRDGNWGRSDLMDSNSTSIGDTLSFYYREGGRTDPESTREVRLYFIPPELDWKVNQTYRWKLNQAWMSDHWFGWVFWNVNGFVDSGLQTSDEYDLFQCEYIELNFWHNAPKGRFDGQEGTIVMENVEMGAFLPPNYTVSSLIRYNPCEGRGKCRAVDGIVQCGDPVVWQYLALLISFVAAVFVVIATQKPYRSVQDMIDERNGRYDRVSASRDGSSEDAEGEELPEVL